MRLNKNFLVHNTNDEVVVVPTGQADFSGVICGNKTLGDILNCLKNETTIDRIILELENKYDVSHEVLEEDVNKAIEKLKSVGAIE